MGAPQPPNSLLLGSTFQKSSPLLRTPLPTPRLRTMVLQYGPERNTYAEHSIPLVQTSTPEVQSASHSPSGDQDASQPWEIKPLRDLSVSAERGADFTNRKLVFCHLYNLLLLSLHKNLQHHVWSCVHMCTCHSTHVGIRGQLSGVYFTMGSQILNSGSPV